MRMRMRRACGFRLKRARARVARASFEGLHLGVYGPGHGWDGASYARMAVGLVGLVFCSSHRHARQSYEPSGRLLGPDQDPTKRVPARIAKALIRQRSARPVG